MHKCFILLFSPFQTSILPGFDPKKIRVSGDGLKPTGVLTSIPTKFNVDVGDEGTSDCDVSIQVI